MKKHDLTGTWELSGNGLKCDGKIPGSVYSILLENGLIEDPFYRDNEMCALAVSEHEYKFSKKFKYKKSTHKIYLCCDGLDTLCDIYINKIHISSTDNMHRSYRFDATEALHNGENEITLIFHPVLPHIKENQAKDPLIVKAKDCMKGFAHLRKAHYMMGWDWGARLPDMGIWRDIYLLEAASSEITDFCIIQRHSNGKVFVTPIVKSTNNCKVEITVNAPNGSMFDLPVNVESEIPDPLLWWPNELGDQPLYTFTASLIENGETVDTKEKRIGLRTLKLIRNRDKYGESYYHEVNGVPFFAMGADYVPEDNILARINRERSEVLLRHC